MSRSTLYRRLNRTLEDIANCVPAASTASEIDDQAHQTFPSAAPDDTSSTVTANLDELVNQGCDAYTLDYESSPESDASFWSDDEYVWSEDEDGDNQCEWQDCMEWGDAPAETDDAQDGSDVEGSLRFRIARWANEYNISHAALLALLVILNFHPSIGLPKDPRTLLQTPLVSRITSMGKGTYHFFGLRSSILSVLRKLPSIPTCRQLRIQLNIDGLPLFKSSSLSLWPILGIIKGISTEVFSHCRVLWKRKTTS